MPFKDPEKRKEYDKAYRDKHIEKRREYDKEYYQKNKEKEKEYMKEYRETPQGKKANRISQWKHKGIIFHDYDLLNDIYVSTTHCYFCKCLLNQCGSSRKCVDHDHDIHDDINVRGIICHVCNARDVLNQRRPIQNLF